MQQYSSWIDQTISVRGSGSPTVKESAGKRVLRAILKTVWLYSLAVWGYAAGVALASPGRVSEPLLLMNGLPRTDTSGIITFGASISCCAILGSMSRVNKPVTRLRRRAIDSALRTMALYGFIGWVYVAANVVENSNTLSLQLMHLSTRPTESQFGVLCFVVSMLASCTLWARQQPAEGDDPTSGAVDNGETQRSAQTIT